MGTGVGFEMQLEEWQAGGRGVSADAAGLEVVLVAVEDAGSVDAGDVVGRFSSRVCDDCIVDSDTRWRRGVQLVQSAIL